MDECKNLQSQSLVNGHLVLKSLSRLSLNSFTNLTSSDLVRITGAVPRLCSLSMEEYFPLFSSTTLKALDQLHDLISLNYFLLYSGIVWVVFTPINYFFKLKISKKIKA